jgi:hypothetical protein
LDQLGGEDLHARPTTNSARGSGKMERALVFVFSANGRWILFGRVEEASHGSNERRLASYRERSGDSFASE